MENKAGDGRAAAVRVARRFFGWFIDYPRLRFVVSPISSWWNIRFRITFDELGVRFDDRLEVAVSDGASDIS